MLTWVPAWTFVLADATLLLVPSDKNDFDTARVHRRCRTLGLAQTTWIQGKGRAIRPCCTRVSLNHRYKGYRRQP